MKPSLRERARRGERLIGGLLRMPSEELVEMIAVAGMDFVLIDCEHGPADVVALRQHVAVASVHQVPVIVRVGESDPGLILRALDQGASGILAPHIDTREDAERLIASTMYPPIGRRGFATYSRAGRFGETDPDVHRDWYLHNTLVLGMLESPLGVANVTDIVATPRLDGIMIGPADLSAATGSGDLPVPDAIAAVNAELSRTGSLRMDIVGDEEAASAAFESGANFVVYNLAHSLMAQFRQMVAPARK